MIIREMADQVATKLRRDNLYTQCVSLWIGYSLSYIDNEGRTGFSKQITIANTNNSKTISDHLVTLFRQYYYGQVVRNIGVNATKLSHDSNQQLSIFEDLETIEKDRDIDKVVDEVRSKFGFSKMIYASSKLEGARALERSKLVGGHAGGMVGLENEKKKKN